MSDVLSHIDPDQIILNNSINNSRYYALDEFNSNRLNNYFESYLLNKNVQSFNAKRTHNKLPPIFTAKKNIFMYFGSLEQGRYR